MKKLFIAAIITLTCSAAHAVTPIAQADTTIGGHIALLSDMCVPDYAGYMYMVFNAEDNLVDAGCWQRKGKQIIARSNTGVLLKWSTSAFKKWSGK